MKKKQGSKSNANPRLSVLSSKAHSKITINNEYLIFDDL